MGMSQGTVKESTPAPMLRLLEGDPQAPRDETSARVADLLERHLRPHAWVASIEVRSSAEALPDRVGVLDWTQRWVRVTADQSVWVQVGWVHGGPLRRQLVGTTLSLVEASLREEELLREREASRTRFELLRQRMVDGKRLAAIGTMAASVAHDIRTPLAVLVLNLKYLEECLEQGEVQDREELDSVLEDNHMAVELIEGVLDSMRAFVVEGDATAAVPIEPIIRSVARLTRWHFSKAGVRLEVRVEGQPTARTTSGELCQILMNLLSNATEVAPEGSTVRLLAAADEECSRIWVADEGPGLTRDQVDVIFEPFHTSKATGMGLGLSIAREMARRHGGDLSVRLDGGPPELRGPTAGACFEIRLPAAPLS